jgi:hypothetical protein
MVRSPGSVDPHNTTITDNSPTSGRGSAAKTKRKVSDQEVRREKRVASIGSSNNPSISSSSFHRQPSSLALPLACLIPLAKSGQLLLRTACLKNLVSAVRRVCIAMISLVRHNASLEATWTRRPGSLSAGRLVWLSHHSSHSFFRNRQRLWRRPFIGFKGTFPAFKAVFRTWVGGWLKSSERPSNPRANSHSANRTSAARPRFSTHRRETGGVLPTNCSAFRQPRVTSQRGNY